MTYAITATSSTLVTLGSVSDNPTTITATGLLNDGLRVTYQGLTVVNAGTITAEGASDGITFTAGGSVTNQSGGAITGFDGIYAKSVAATVVNTGSITGLGRYGAGIALLSGGSVTNQSGGTISGYNGIYAKSVAATVVNAGSIAAFGPGDGIVLLAGGSVTNQSGGSISGIVDESGAVTVVNAGRSPAAATALPHRGRQRHQPKRRLDQRDRDFG